MTHVKPFATLKMLLPALGLVLVTGCATTEADNGVQDVQRAIEVAEQAQRTAERAEQAARRAQETADAAQRCCTENQRNIDRALQRMQQK